MSLLKLQSLFLNCLFIFLSPVDLLLHLFNFFNKFLLFLVFLGHDLIVFIYLGDDILGGAVHLRDHLDAGFCVYG